MGFFYCLDYRFRNIMSYNFIKDKYEVIKCDKCCDEGEEEEDNEDADKGPPLAERNFWVDWDQFRPPVTYNGYMVEADGDIWGVFVTKDDRRVRVKKLDLSKKCWIKLESLGNKCLYVSTNSSFAESCSIGGMTNKIYFNKFHEKSGVIYSLTSRMYHSVGGSFVSKEAYGLSEEDNGVWIKPTLPIDLLKEGIDIFGLFSSLVTTMNGYSMAIKRMPKSNANVIGLEMIKIAISIRSINVEMEKQVEEDDDYWGIMNLIVDVLHEAGKFIKKISQAIMPLKVSDKISIMNCLENLLTNCRQLAKAVDMLGPDPPPRNILHDALDKIERVSVKMESDVNNILDEKQNFGKACRRLVNALEQLKFAM